MLNIYKSGASTRSEKSDGGQQEFPWAPTPHGAIAERCAAIVTAMKREFDPLGGVMRCAAVMIVFMKL